jgi:hypothetical protein
MEVLEDRTLLSFIAPINYPTGGVRALVVDDLRHNGKLDIVAADGGFGVSVLLGNGDGTFQPQVLYPAAPSPRAIALGDFNGDGNRDLVVTDAGDVDEGHTVSVLLGNGDGSFQSPRTFPVGRHPTGVAVGDLRHNGKFDIVTANQNSESVSVLLGNGDGTFQPAVNYDVDVLGPDAVAVGDLRGNGRLDIVTANGSGKVSVLLGNGDGTFQRAVSYSLGGAVPRAIALGDFHGDHKLDIVTANDGPDSGGSYSLFRGNGDGTFQPGVLHAIDSQSPLQLPLALAVADLTGAGKLDLVIGNLNNIVTVVLGHGDGTFQAPTFVRGGALTNAVAVADFDGDGKPDLAVGNQLGNDVSVIFGNGDGTFQTVPTYGPGGSSLAEGHFRGNDIVDLVTTNTFNDTVSVLLGNGDGTFGPAVDYPAGFHPHFVAVADVNGDGIPDLIVLDTSQAPLFQGTISVLLGNGDGTFQAPRTSIVQLDLGSDFLMSLAIGDLSGGGSVDLAVTEQIIGGRDGNTSGVVVLQSNGDGTFRTVSRTIVAVGLIQPNKVVIGDFDRDGHNDIAFTSLAGVFVLFGPGFSQGDLIGPGNGSLAAADLRRNGNLDLIATSSGDRTVRIYLGNGDGTFAQATPLQPFHFAAAVAVGDINGDGIFDLVVAYPGDLSVSVLLGHGDGTFQQPDEVPRYLVGGSPSALVVDDFDGDGRLDIATNNVSVLLDVPDQGGSPGGRRGAVTAWRAPSAAPLFGPQKAALEGTAAAPAATSDGHIPRGSPTTGRSRLAVEAPTADPAALDTLFHVNVEAGLRFARPGWTPDALAETDAWWTEVDPGLQALLERRSPARREAQPGASH